MSQTNNSNACIVCGTVLDGPIGRIMNMFGIRRSPQNPNICNRCSTHIEVGSIAELTILFADLVGFTSMTNELGAQKSYDIVNSLFKKATEVLVKHDAFIDKFIGDAVLAFFNIPIHHADHTQKAIEAAIEFQDSLQPLREEFNRDLQFRISIASGYAHVGHLGSKERKDYTAIGEVVNLASRLQAVAAPGEIVLNESAYQKTMKLYPAMLLETIYVKGFTDAVKISRIQTKSSAPHSSDSLQKKPVFNKRRAASIGAILFALLGAPCAAAALLGPLSIIFGAGVLFGALSPILSFFDQTIVRIPFQSLALLLAGANLYVIFYGYRIRRKNKLMQTELKRFERYKVTLVAAMSILALLFIALEYFFHIQFGNPI
ncbi:MAG: adenylate/guanylate cyclase domain-containing protein [Bacteroidota bacterium]